MIVADVEMALASLPAARGPAVAAPPEKCADLRFGQELGEGIKRMFEEMRRSDLTDPVYRQTSGSVKLILNATARLDPAVAARLPAGSQEVLDQLRQAGRPMSTGDLAEVILVSRPTLIQRLRALQAAGVVNWSGKSSNDPRAVWSLAD